jgi:hypothetical protein
MIKQIILLLMLIFTTVFISSCRSITVLADNVSQAYTNKTYGTSGSYETSSSRLYYPDATQFSKAIESYRKEVLEDKTMTKSEKEKVITRISSHKYVLAQYITFYISVQKTLSKKEADLKFEFNDAKRKPLIADILYMPTKITSEYYYSSTPGYSYIWIIKTNKPLVRKNFAKDEIPFKLNIIYPNGQNRLYKVNP